MARLIAYSSAVVFCLSLSLVTSTAAAGDCLVVQVRDAAGAGQDIRMEAHGDHAVRVRAVPAGGTFVDAPDVVSALVAPSTLAEPCATYMYEYGGASSSYSPGLSPPPPPPPPPPPVTSGNMRVSVGSDGKLSFTRASDNKLLLREKAVRVLAPTKTTPPVPGFLSLDMTFEAVKGERIYGLGQHAAFAWDKDWPINGQLNQKGLPAPIKMEPGDGDVTIPVYHSSEGYAFLSNLPSVGTVAVNRHSRQNEKKHAANE